MSKRPYYTFQKDWTTLDGQHVIATKKFTWRQIMRKPKREHGGRHTQKRYVRVVHPMVMKLDKEG